jgi:hypothetical protein
MACFRIQHTPRSTMRPFTWRTIRACVLSVLRTNTRLWWPIRPSQTEVSMGHLQKAGLWSNRSFFTAVRVVLFCGVSPCFFFLLWSCGGSPKA